LLQSRWVVFAILALAVPVAGQRAAPTDTAALRREIEQLNRGMVDAVNRGDLKGAAAFYADDAVVRTATSVVAAGRTAIDRYFESIGKATWQLDVIAVGGHPDAPYQVGRSTLIHGTGPNTSIVNFVVYWKRQANGQLRILLDYYHSAGR
jgi:ketosteroid isomerase-like protein